MLCAPVLIIFAFFDEDRDAQCDTTVQQVALFYSFTVQGSIPSLGAELHIVP